MESTVRYLGIAIDDALAIAEQTRKRSANAQDGRRSGQLF
jgi:hypothetical protein